MSNKKTTGNTPKKENKPVVTIKRLNFKTINNGQLLIKDTGEEFLPNYHALADEELRKTIEVLSDIKPGKNVIITLTIEVEDTYKSKSN